MKNSWLIATESGIQEEAPSLKVPVLVTRDTTEGWRLLTVVAMLIWSYSKELEDKILNYIMIKTYTPEKVDKSPFGNGNASEVIIETIINEFAQ